MGIINTVSICNMNYWLHRISLCAELSHPLLDMGFLTIGYSDFLQEEGIIEKILSDGDKLTTINRISRKCGWGCPRSRYYLKYFVNMRRGDIVVVPLYGSFGVYEIDDDKPNVISELPIDKLKTWSGKEISTENGLLKIDGEKEPADLGFFRKVRPIESSITRSDYANEPLFLRLKTRHTTSNISDIKEHVENAVNRFRKGKKLNLNSIITDDLIKVLGDKISNINTDKRFEELVSGYFKSLGAELYIPAKNESGKENGADADVVAIFETLKTIYYVQVKKHYKETETNEWAIYQINEYIRLKSKKLSVDDGYSKIAWVISSADRFSECARNLAMENGVMLFTRTDFAKMLIRVGIRIFER